MKPQTKTIIISILATIVLIILLSYAIILLQQPNTEQASLSDNTVIRIIDGDTFELSSGDIIRLICVDAPEIGKQGADEAAIFLSSLILNKEVRLESDIDDKDDYGRLLRYVYIDELFVNKEIVSQGYGSVFRYGNNTKLCGEIEK